MKTVAYSDVAKWISQIERERLAWVGTQGNASRQKLTEREVEAYRAGLKQGMMSLLNTLSLHGSAAIDYNK